MRTAVPVSTLIRDDHEQMRRLFEDLEVREHRPLAAPVLLALLAAHSRAEEAEVYPALRNGSDDNEAVAHSQEEHAEADRLVERLVQADLDDDEFDRTLRSLVKAVNHHIEEEESTVLTIADGLPEDEQRQLGASFVAARSAALISISDHLTRSQLEQQARNEGASGIRSMTREQLKHAVTANDS